MAPSSNTRVRVNAAAADTKPLFNDVKNADTNMFRPQIMKLSMYSRMACAVSDLSCGS